MRAILEFCLDEPGDRFEHKMALQGSSYKDALLELDDWLRAEDKYRDRPDGERALIVAIREHIHELCQERGLDLHEDLPHG